ncbi:hypothetical protein T4B_4343 [Trichinella pseudospiralis]|uniref:Uncharacterized protein n=1 Tax=Trichinella pseudospiralis TaxID=6337 RepID=A0A0V1GMB0_TRIPS|nr:hypothetical protein T4B_4343 [Trichinella pseudospiralis]
MSFLPINLATVKASATDIAHKRDPAVWVEEKVGKGILKRILRMLGDYAKVDKVEKGKGWRGNFKMD